jgi:hypothetical protein
VSCHRDAPRICAPRKLLTAVQQIHTYIAHLCATQAADCSTAEFKEQFRFSKVEFRVILSNMLDINGGKLVDNVGLPVMNFLLHFPSRWLTRLSYGSCVSAN